MTTSIGDEINAATRSHHTTLNQLILELLPLALPPHAASNELYALGISHFLPIYSAIESSLRTYASTENPPLRTHDVLRALHLPALERAEALENDIKLLLPPLHRVPNTCHNPRLQAFRCHIESSLVRKPHLLFAYTWIFYMALFSGGRYIRSKLRTAFTPSNTSTSQRHLDKPAGLSFWNFPGDADGEDLKLEFKARVARLSNDLSEEEKADIVAEGVHIMVSLTDVVREVAETVPERASALKNDTRPSWVLLLRYFVPMGLMGFLSAAVGFASFKAPQDGATTPIPMHVAAK
ncbi:MAG: hypothetical protein Q9209_005073 [Squamulea sp. 1 TL-2023]